MPVRSKLHWHFGVTVATLAINLWVASPIGVSEGYLLFALKSVAFTGATVNCLLLAIWGLAWWHGVRPLALAPSGSGQIQAGRAIFSAPVFRSWALFVGRLLWLFVVGVLTLASATILLETDLGSMPLSANSMFKVLAPFYLLQATIGHMLSLSLPLKRFSMEGTELTDSHRTIDLTQPGIKLKYEKLWDGHLLVNSTVTIFDDGNKIRYMPSLLPALHSRVLSVMNPKAVVSA